MLVEGVQLAHGGDVEKHPTKDLYVAFKGALGGNPATDKVGQLGVIDFNRVEFCSDRAEEVRRECVEGMKQHGGSPDSRGGEPLVWAANDLFGSVRGSYAELDKVGRSLVPGSLVLRLTSRGDPMGSGENQM